ncbi:hypothetical protein E4U54_002123, partial [Claviceps lovelessii]
VGSLLTRLCIHPSRSQTERNQSQTIPPNSSIAQITPILGASPQASLALPVQCHAHRSGGNHRRGTSLPPQLAPLAINNNNNSINNSNISSRTVSPSELLMDSRRASSPGDPPNSATETPREKYTKVVAFEFPATEVARCHSPSWEAYERRKIEKKMEKKERGEAKRDGTKRLSKKPPPSSSPKALQHALASEADVARGRVRERTENTATVSESGSGSGSGSGPERKPGRKARSRSGSFVSMLRAPFEFRRSASTDQVNDPEFIGGIKLELERFAHQQQNLDSNAVEDESNIHPALRKNNNQVFHVPLVSPTGGTDQRRYPPITRGNNNNNNHHQKTASRVIPPTASALHDASRIDKWRTRVGLKVGAGSRPQSVASHDEELQLRGPQDQSIGYVQPEEHVPSALRQPREQLKSPTSPVSSSTPAHVAFAVGYSTTTTTAPPSPSVAALAPPAQAGESEKQSESRRQPRKHSNNESVSSTSSAVTGYKTAPSSPPPPEPPQRSARRHSVVSSVESIPPVPVLTQQQQQQQQQQQHQQQHQHQYQSDAHASTTRDDKSPPPAQRSFPLYAKGGNPNGRHSRCEWIGGAAYSPPAAGQMSPYLSSPTKNAHGPTSSSEDSCDEGFQSASSISTPATSRPQSEREMPLTCSQDDTVPSSVHDAVRACFGTTYPLPSADNSEDEGGIDPIQAAAEKVLAVFNGIPVQRPDGRRRRDSPTSLAMDTSFDPSATERPLNLCPQNKPTAAPLSSFSSSPFSSSSSSSPPPSPSPAGYLEQARKQPPAAAPTRAHKQRFGPPASFVLPADCSNAANHANEKSRPVLAMSHPVRRRHLRHKSTPHLATTDRDPIARIFVECCSCTRYHDMPSNLYKAMTNPEGVLSPADKCEYAGALSMTVRCSWCKHEMSVRCCSAFSTKVYIQERLHSSRLNGL